MFSLVIFFRFRAHVHTVALPKILSSFFYTTTMCLLKIIDALFRGFIPLLSGSALEGPRFFSHLSSFFFHMHGP